MPTVEVYTGYTARPALEPFHNRTQRTAILITHRQFGKTVGICNDAIERALQNDRVFPPPAYAWFYPTRVRAKDIAWKYLKHYSQAIPGHSFMETELRVLFPNNASITLYGADKSRGVGLTLDGVYYDEADEIPQKVVAEVDPTLAAFKGFTVFAGMLKGRYNLFKRYENAANDASAFRLMIRASESRLFDDEELARMRATMGEAAYQMQLECNANAAIANAIYGLEMDGLRKADHIKLVATDPGVCLDFFFDIGHSLSGDDWAAWGLQFSGRDVLALDSFSNTGKLPAFYAAKILEICEARKVGLGWVYLPHDGSRQDRNGRSVKDELEAAGINRIKIVPRTPNIWDGINALRARLPRFYINHEGCSKGWTLGDMDMPSGIDALDFYTKKQDVTTGLITDVPVHNQFSHLADALRTYAEADKQGLLEGTAETTRHYEASPTRYKVTREPMERQQSRQYRVSR